MYRFAKLKPSRFTVITVVVIALCVAALVVLDPILHKHPPVWDANRPSSEVVQDVRSGSDHVDYPQPNDPNGHAFIRCDARGASLRLVYKWLEMDGRGIADKCMAFEDIVDLVKQELPGLHESIDRHNAQVDAEWRVVQQRIRQVAAKDPKIAVHELLAMRCGEPLMSNTVRRWTLFKDASPLGVRIAIGQIYKIDRDGYSDDLTKYGDHQYDTHYYEQQIASGPFDALYDYKWLDVYGDYHDAYVSTVIEGYYEAARLESEEFDLPQGLSRGTGGAPICS